MIIPCIDISEGQAVQWRQGREPLLELGDPVRLAERFGRFGEIAVVDLDAALGRGDNFVLIERLCKVASCRVGGGLRTVEAGRRMLKAGARRIIVGTQAVPDFLTQFPASCVLAAIDVDGETVVDHGWRNQTAENVERRIARLAPFVSGFVYTAVDREGTGMGAEMDRFERVARLSPVPVAVAGGIVSADEVVALDRLGIDCHVGLALHTGEVNLVDAFVACVDFDKGGGLVPAMMCDLEGRLLMQAWMNPEALRRSLESGDVYFWSRSRERLWRKGGTSGQTFCLLTVRPDCDRDSLQVVVDSRNSACHRGTMSCFGDDRFRIEDLERFLSVRASAPSPESWTARLSENPPLLKQKLIEEAGELADAEDPAHIAHEAADVIYHTLALLAARRVPWSDVVSQLSGRRKNSPGVRLW